MSAMTILVTREPKILSSAPFAAPRYGQAANSGARTSAQSAGRRRDRIPLTLDRLTRQRELAGEHDRQDHHRRLRLVEFTSDELGKRISDEAKPDASGDRVGERHGDRGHYRRGVFGDVLPIDLREPARHHAGDIEK